MTRRTLVFDTSVVMDDPLAHLAYPGNDIVIPLTVVDELDGGKKKPGSAGRNAREFLNTLWDTCRDDDGCWRSDAVPTEDGSTLRVAVNGVNGAALEHAGLSATKADHRIIGTALGLHPSVSPVVVVSADTGLRIKAETLGQPAIEHTPVTRMEHTGIHYVAAPQGVNSFPDKMRFSDLPTIDDEQVGENEFVIIEGTALTYRRSGRMLKKVNSKANPWGFKARNKEQAFALDLLTDDEVPLVALKGSAGTGKSLLAIAAGLDAVVEQARFSQLLILRPMMSVGQQEIGFLPGDISEKTAPWFDMVMDVLMAPRKGEPTRTYTDAKGILDDLIESGKVSLQPVTFLRGRTLHNTFVVLDEAQNLSNLTVKTVLSRLGEGSKAVLTGDPGQIDDPYLTPATCGLNTAITALSGSALFGHVTFAKGERSQMANLVADRM